MAEKMTWMGRDLDDLSRQELYSVIEYLADEVRLLHRPDEIRARAIGKVEMIKREATRRALEEKRT